MGKKPFEKNDLEDEESFEKYILAIGANIFDINEEIEEEEQREKILFVSLRNLLSLGLH